MSMEKQAQCSWGNSNHDHVTPTTPTEMAEIKDYVIPSTDKDAEKPELPHFASWNIKLQCNFLKTQTYTYQKT